MFRQASSDEWRRIVASALAQSGIACWEYHLATGELWWSENTGPLFGREPGFVPDSFEAAMSMVHPEDGRPVDIDVIVAALESGPVETERRAVWPDGSTRWTAQRYFLMTGPSGQPERIAGMMNDIEDRKRAEQHDATLHSVNEVLMGSVDLADTLQKAAELLVPDIADWCVIELLEEAVLQPFVRSHIDPEKLRWAETIESEYPVDMDAPLGSPNVVRTGRPELYPEIPDELLVEVVEGDERLLEILRQVGYRSVIVVPLRARQDVIGTMTLVLTDSGRRYDEQSLSFAERIASQMAVSIETARLHTNLREAWAGQRVAVETLQRGLAPVPLPDLESVELSGHYEIGGTDQVGGDWYDVFEASDGKVCMVIGDVAGRGVPAVAAMSRYRHSLMVLLSEGHSPAKALTVLNCLNGCQSDQGSGFATAVCATYEPDDRMLTWSVAGHLPPMIRHEEGKVEALSYAHGPPLDVMPSFEYTEQAVEIVPGTMLVLYTDGLVERRGESIDDSLNRLISELESAPPTPKAAVQHLLDRMLAEPSPDDVAIVAALF